MEQICQRIRLQNEAREQARADLLFVIKHWDDIKRIQAFFSDAESSVSNLPEAERCIAMEKLGQARELVGELDPLQALLEWKGPQEC